MAAFLVGLAKTAVGSLATVSVALYAAVMTLYLLGQRVDKLRFLGTSAWFFLCINLAKLPFSTGLGLIHGSMLSTTLLLSPLVVAGGVLGMRLARRLQQRSFEVAVLVASAISTGALLIR